MAARKTAGSSSKFSHSWRTPNIEDVGTGRLANGGAALSRRPVCPGRREQGLSARLRAFHRAGSALSFLTKYRHLDEILPAPLAD